MPPKKATKAAATPSKADDGSPATITNSRGKEFAATAAVGRPHRESAVAQATPTVKKTTKSPAAKPASKKRTATEAEADDPSPPKKRGRPAKNATAPPKKEAPKKVGRPSKQAAATDDATPKKRGRPAKKTTEMAPAVPEDEPEPKRGAAPFGGESTKQDGDGDAAAEQLEEELADTAEVSNSKPASKKGKGKGKGKAAKPDNEANGALEVDEAADAVVAGGKQYWLMKAEQETRFETAKNGQVNDTKFTIDDLRSKDVPEPWDGVRNAVAAKNMRTMQKGDLAFFYASGGKQGRKPGITGIMEIVSEHEPDPTVHDEGSYGYVEKEGDRARWCIVKVEFRKKLSVPVSLAELQKYDNGTGVLSKMQALKTTRISVSAVSEGEWNFIVDNLIEGYEGEDAELPNGSSAAAMPEVAESEPPTTDTALPASTNATSRPASRQGSKAPASRQGSKAPSRGGSRANSEARTTKAATAGAEVMAAVAEENGDGATTTK